MSATTRNTRLILRPSCSRYASLSWSDRRRSRIVPSHVQHVSPGYAEVLAVDVDGFHMLRAANILWSRHTRPEPIRCSR